MSSQKQTFAKNATLMMASQLFTWVLSFILTLYLPRYLGPEAVGQMSIAGSIWSIMGVLLSFGMDTYITKTVARKPELVGNLLLTSIVVRCSMFLFGALIVLAYSLFMGYDAELGIIIGIYGLATLGSLFTSTVTAALTGLERMEYISLANVATKVVIVGLSLIFLFAGLNVFWIAGVNIVASVVYIAIMIYAVQKLIKVEYKFDLGQAWQMVRNSMPYLVTGLTLMTYQQIDTLFISTLVDAEAVGYYSTSMNLFGTLMFLPSVIGTVILPILSRSFAQDTNQLAMISRRGFDLMLMISMPLGFGLLIVAQPFIHLLYGDSFLPAGQILSLLGIVLIFTYLNTFLGQLLISSDRTGRLNIVMVVAIGVTLPLDLLLIPWTERTMNNGAMGGALSFMITEFGMLASSILLLPKNTLTWSNVRSAALVLVSSTAMLLASWWLRDSFILIPILVGAVTYLAMILVLRVISQEDWNILRQAANQIRSRIRPRTVPAGASGD